MTQKKIVSLQIGNAELNTPRNFVSSYLDLLPLINDWTNDTQISLSNYLPNDGGEYEITVSGAIEGFMALYVHSDACENLIGIIQSEPNGVSCSSAVVPIGANRTLVVHGIPWGKVTPTFFHISGYRRIN